MRPVPAALCALAAVAAAVLPLSPERAVADDGSFTIRDGRITESSGLAASRRHPGVYWTVNDSGDGPYVFAVDGRTGRTVARITMRGVGEPRDVEAVSVGPDGQVYVGDIGDNMGGSWDHVWIYRFPEPEVLKDQTLTATQYDVRYQGGARDAEALMVHPKTGRVYIASKREDGGALYAGPATLRTGGMNIFRKVAPIALYVTDGAFSPDGTRLALRSYFGGRMYAWHDGRPEEDGRLEVPIQRQGESVTYTTDGKALMYGTEGEGSEVTRIALPESHRGRSGSSSGGSGGTGGGPGRADDGSGPDRKLLLGGIALVGATVLLTGMRKARRRT